MAARSASPIHFQAINASSEEFWIGKSTSTYCAIDDCPPGNTTAFIYDNGGVSLDTEVPGGQRVYVTPLGVLGFTQAHSASAPEGADFGNFTYTPATSANTLGSLSYTGQGASGFIACPLNPAEETTWQILADVSGLEDDDVPGGDLSACLGFSATTPLYTSSDPAAWQYS
ncbi:MAG: hypothetical protein M1819_003738 [Sarea resinae]|nr:MAG: hypothetical protein M1819_003738 [Sarea resinae]